jgi:hypothetical protein
MKTRAIVLLGRRDAPNLSTNHASSLLKNPEDSVSSVFALKLVGPGVVGRKSPYGAGNWSLFTLTEPPTLAGGQGGYADVFFLPPVAGPLLEGAIVEDSTRVPDNWFPLIPQRSTDEPRLKLERLQQQSAANIEPYGRFVDLTAAPIYDNELPREGGRLTRNYVLSRRGYSCCAPRRALLR